MATNSICVTFAEKTIATTITNKPSVAAKWIGEITTLYSANPTVVGFYVQWHVDKWSDIISASLQLCVDKKCIILQLFDMDEIPEALKAFLLNPNFTFAVVKQTEISQLKNMYCLECTKSIDLVAAGREALPGVMFDRPELEKLAMQMCGVNLRRFKHFFKNESEEKNLSYAQVEYATVAAYASYRIGLKLSQASS